MSGLFGLSLAGQFAGSLLSAWGMSQAGSAEDDIAQRDAAILDEQAAEERRNRSVASVEERKQSAHRIASMEARYAKSGLDAGTGTPTYMMAEQAESDEFNILSADRASEIWAQDREYQADMRRYEGTSAKKSARMNTIKAVIGGVAGVAGAASKLGKSIGAKNTPTGPLYGNRTAPTIQPPIGATGTNFTPSYGSGMMVKKEFSMF